MHIVNAAIALVAVAAITTAVLASHPASTTKPSLMDTVRRIVEYVETTKVPPSATTTPGFECHNDDAVNRILRCDFTTKPTFDQSRAIVAEFESMKAVPQYSSYREDNGLRHEFADRKWVVTTADFLSDVSLMCKPRTTAHYDYVSFRFASQPAGSAEPPSLMDAVRYILKHAETTTTPPPDTATPGFKCRTSLIDDDHLYCDFVTKPTFDQVKAIVEEFKSVGARPLLGTYYREDDGTVHVFDYGGWTVLKAKLERFPDVTLGCWPRIRTHDRNVYFEFRKK